VPVLALIVAVYVWRQRRRRPSVEGEGS
jgi:hypothetical protein